MEKFDLLNKHQYMNLTTYRRNGTAVITPVWFAQETNRIVMVTASIAGKLKRIRNNAQCEVGPSDMRGKALGPTLSAQARVLDEAEGKAAEALLNRKYGLVKKLWNWFLIRGKPMSYIEIK